MESKTTQVETLKSLPKGEVALFWDYENVPVPRQKHHSFLQALRIFFQQHPPARARIYAHKEVIPANVLKDVRRAGPFRVNWVTGTKENAADKVMMQSARDTLRTRPNLPYLVMITGDGDFQDLLGELGAGVGQTILICGQQNYNYRLFKNSPHVFSTIYLANHPENWWEIPKQKRIPIIQKQYPLKFCPKCETALIVRGLEGGYQYWCPTCGFLSKKTKHPKKTPADETSGLNRKFIGL